MATPRSIASLTLSFGLVSIPVRLYSATETAASVKFNLLSPDGSRLKQQYVSEKDGKVVARAEMVKGYEFEKDRFVLFSADELKALEESSSPVIEIVAFIPEKSVDPLYYDKAYMLAPDKRGGKPYTLLLEAMKQSGRCALAKWAWKAKQHVVQVRASEDGIVLQQLLYADEVRSFKDLSIEQEKVSGAELQLALQLIDQIAEDAYEPEQFQDEEKKRILAAIDAKIAGQDVVASVRAGGEESGAQIIDLVAALKASLGKKPEGAAAPAKAAPTAPKGVPAAAEAAADAEEKKPARKAAKRAAPEEATAEDAPARAARGGRK
jgi:DNA end-binding protein Ku